MFCYKCGTEIPNESEFCMNCGTKIPKKVNNQPNDNINEIDSVPMDMVINSGLNSVITVNKTIISYKTGFTTHDIKVSEIQSARYTPASFNAAGYLYITDRKKEHVIPFNKKNNDLIAELCGYLPSLPENQNIPQEGNLSLKDNFMLGYTGQAVNVNTQPTAPKEKPLTKHQRIKQNKKNGVACCPKCGSTSLSSNKQGFGIGKAVIGAGLVSNPIGLVAGNIHSKKIHVTCLNCGHKWKI